MGTKQSLHPRAQFASKRKAGHRLPCLAASSEGSSASWAARSHTSRSDRKKCHTESFRQQSQSPRGRPPSATLRDAPRRTSPDRPIWLPCYSLRSLLALNAQAMAFVPIFTDQNVFIEMGVETVSYTHL